MREGRKQEAAGGRGEGSRERGEKDGMREWAERRNRRTPTKYGHLDEVESFEGGGGQQTHGKNHASAVGRAAEGNGDACPTQE